MNSIEEKYNIEYVYGKRYYVEDLTKRSFNYEYTTPFMFVMNDKTYFESSWKQMILKITSVLVEESNIPKSQFLELKNDWGNQDVFSETSHKNYEILPNGLYMNLNHNAVHDMWTLQLILQFFNVDLSLCKLLIKRNGVSEPEECRKYFRIEAKGGFKRYLNIENVSEIRIETFIKNIDILNKYMPYVSKSHDDLWLFDDPNTYYNYRVELINFLIKKNVLCDQKKVNAAYNSLNYLGKYIYRCYGQ